MFSARWTPAFFALFLSGQMSFLVSGLSTYRAIGLIDGFLATWISAWLVSWAVAFPAAMLCRRSAQWMVSKVIAA